MGFRNLPPLLFLASDIILTFSAEWKLILLISEIKTCWLKMCERLRLPKLSQQSLNLLFLKQWNFHCVFVCVCVLSRPIVSDSFRPLPWTVAQQSPLSTEFLQEKYRVGCHFLLEIFPPKVWISNPRPCIGKGGIFTTVSSESSLLPGHFYKAYYSVTIIITSIC